jgi:Family of unknown function (DUF5677)
MPNVNDTEDLYAFASRLEMTGARIINVAQPSLVGLATNHPKAVAITLLCRTLSNFRAVVKLLREGMIMEARAILRCAYENLIFIAALKQQGGEGL